MPTLAQTYPPLGQVTPLKNGYVDLRAVLEITGSQTDDSWQVSIWHSVDGNNWAEAQLDPLPSASQPECLHPWNGPISKRYYASVFFFQESLRYTLKLRPNSESDWIWARDEYGLEDGSVILQAQGPSSDAIGEYIGDLNQAWEASSCLSETPRTRLWSLEASVPRPRVDHGEDDGDVSTFRDIPIGVPKNGYLRWFAIVRHSSAWLAPRQGKEHLYLDRDAILVAFLTRNGRCLVFLGLGGITTTVSILRSTSDGHLFVHARSDCTGHNEEKATVLVAEGADLEHAVAAAVYHARARARNCGRISIEHLAKKVHSLRKLHLHPKQPEEQLESWCDGLGFCTWNSLGQKLTEKSIIDCLDTLADNNIQISNFIVDDGWQSIDSAGEDQFQRAWVDFEADPKSFPNGLKATISRIREKHPTIKYIAVWHALLGYWGGISPDGRLATDYKTLELAREDEHLSLGGRMTVIDDEDVFKFYEDFYRFLSDAGVNAVKTDVQFMVDTWMSADARRELLFNYLDNWSLVALRQFDMRATSCMSLFPQWLFSLQLGAYLPPYPVRTSDDFFPDVPDSHPWHVWANAHNCVLLQPFGVLPDWDMFQTAHEYAGFHAAARCISGGPVYITDIPGEHNMEIINQISGKTPRGKTIVFRPSVIGRAILPFVGYQDNTLLKIRAYHGASENGTPIMAIFNVSNCRLTELVPLSNFSGTIESMEYVVRAHTTGLVSSPTKLQSPNSLFNVSLDARGYEILSAFPLKLLPRTNQRPAAIANIGLMGKMTGCVAIMSSKIQKQDNGRALVGTSLKAVGVLGVYISCLPDLTIDSDFMVTIRGRAVPVHTVRVSAQSHYVLEVDVEAAWEEMELQNYWGEEAEVKISFAV